MSEPRPYKIFLDSGHLACKPNRVLTCTLLRYFRENKHEIIEKAEEADFIVYNTCGFTKTAENLCLAFFKENLKKVKKDTRIISVGCLNRINPKLYQKELDQQVITIDKGKDLDSFFLSTTPYDQLKGEYIDEDLLQGLQKRLHNINAGFYYYIEGWLEKIDPLLKKSRFLKPILEELGQQNNFFVKISSGCLGECTYCIIKKARGKPVSRRPEDIIDDIKRIYLPEKTLYLVADDCGSYGLDIGSSFPVLLERINSEFPGIKIKINYLNPIWLSQYEEKYLDLMKGMNILGVNLSIQSGSNRIIKNMNRAYDVEEIIRIIKKIKKISPSTLLWTHLIIGFPGEGLWDYLKTLSIIRYFSFVAIFAYSDREGTKSAMMPDKKSSLTIALRSKLAGLYSWLLIIINTLTEAVVAMICSSNRQASSQGNLNRNEK